MKPVQQLLNLLFALVLPALLFALPPAFANHHEEGKQTTATPAQDSGNAVAVNAEVRKIDTANNKITLKHEALTQFNMGAMTMAFRVADPAFLQRFSVGDKVKFVLARQNGQLVVVAMEKAN